MNRRLVIKQLQDEYADLTQRAAAIESALEGFGASKRRRVSRPRVDPKDRRVVNARAVDDEVVRVVTEGGSMTVQDIHTLGNFDCSQSGIYHAVHRNPRLEMVPVGKTQRQVVRLAP